MKVYGPYYRKDGRQHVVIVEDSGKKRTVSYPKYLVEQKFGRQLDPMTETIDHIDTDFTNNSIDNLRIIPRSQHASEDAKRRKFPEVKCIWCETIFKLTRNQEQKKKKAGPFCSRHCSGQYGSHLQHGYTNKLETKTLPEKEFYTLKSLDIPKTNVE